MSGASPLIPWRLASAPAVYYLSDALSAPSLPAMFWVLFFVFVFFFFVFLFVILLSIVDNKNIGQD